VHLVGLKVAHKLMNGRRRELKAVGAVPPSAAAEAGVLAIGVLPAVGVVVALVLSDRTKEAT